MELHVTLRAIVYLDSELSSNEMQLERETTSQLLETAAKTILSNVLDTTDEAFVVGCFKHIACAVLQHRLRLELVRMKAIAFVADGSILPRRSGASSLPMASPPAIPFKAPADSSMTQQISIDMGKLAAYISDTSASRLNGTAHVVTLTGLVVPSGVSIIVGGGFHGKVSHNGRLQAIADSIMLDLPWLTGINCFFCSRLFFVRLQQVFMTRCLMMVGNIALPFQMQ